MEHRLDDIVFENRNKSYGAYLMRVLYEKHLVKSLIIAGSVFILGLITLLILNNIFAKPEVRMTMTTVEVLPEPESIDPEAKAPPELPKIDETKVEQAKFVTVAITNEDIKQENIATQKELQNALPSGQDNKGNPDSLPVATTPVTGAGGDTSGTAQPFMNVSRDASAGYDVKEFLRKNVTYPTSERLAGNEATVYVTFTVTKEGKITNVQAQKGFSKAFEDEAIKWIQSMPDWKPAMQNGHPIALKKKQAVHFKLDENND